MLRNRFWKDTSGNIATVFGVTAPLALLFIGVGVDLTLSLDTKAKMQNAVDGAVLAAAINSDEENFEEIGQSSFAANMSQTRLPNADINITQENGVIQAEASGAYPSFFAGVLPKSNIDIAVEAVADPAKVNSAEPCIMALRETGTSVNFNGRSTIAGAGCEMHVHSQSSRAMTLNSRADITMNRTCIAGSGFINNSNSDTDTIETDCEVAPDPYAGTIPVPPSLSCDYRNQNFNGREVTLQPGVYARIQFNSGVLADVSAPTSGDYADILMAERPGLPRRDFILNDSRGFDAQGTIYLPSKRLVMNGGSNIESRKMKLIADSFVFNGGSFVSLEPTGTVEPIQTASPFIVD